MSDEALPGDVIELKTHMPAVIQEARGVWASIKDQESINSALAWCNTQNKIVQGVIARLAIGKKKAREAWQEWCTLETDATTERVNAIKKIKERAGTVQLDINRQQRLTEEKQLADSRKEHEAKMEKEAKKLEKQGNPAMADAARASNYVAPIMEPSKPQGGTISTVIRARVINKIEFVNMVAGRPDLLPFLEIDVKKLADYNKTMNGTVKLNGIEFYEEPRVALRGVA